MTRRRGQLTRKQRKRLVANSKIRKQTKEKMIARLNAGDIYGGKQKIVPAMRTITGPDGKPITVQSTFWHLSKDHLKMQKQPPRYKPQR